MRADAETPLVLSEVWPRALSAAMIGVSVIGLTFHDLGQALWPINVFTPFFAIIVAGAVGVGCAFAWGGLSPRARRWTFHDGRIDVVLQPLFSGNRIVAIRPGDVAIARLAEHDWDSREMTWSVDVELVDGRRLGTPEIGTKARAESILARIAAFKSGPESL